MKTISWITGFAAIIAMIVAFGAFGVAGTVQDVTGIVAISQYHIASPPIATIEKGEVPALAGMENGKWKMENEWVSNGAMCVVQSPISPGLAATESVIPSGAMCVETMILPDAADRPQRYWRLQNCWANDNSFRTDTTSCAWIPARTSWRVWKC